MKLDYVKIKNFKCLRDIEIPLGNLTLISGANSSGKSSFIQAFVLIKQNASLGNVMNFMNTGNLEDFMKLWKRIIPFTVNGEYINLGDARSLLYQEYTGEKIVLEFGSDKGSCALNVDVDSSEAKIETRQGRTQEKPDTVFDSQKRFDRFLRFFATNFYYLQTDHIAPSLAFPFSERHLKENSIGIKGEYAAHFLAENRHLPLKIEALRHPDSETLQLLENTYKWLGEISPGVSITASADPATQSVKLMYQYDYGGNTTSHYSPLNVGFGVTYALPVIVLILKSQPGDLLIIENPESHLHPAGQTKIAELCAIAAHNGVQIVVETHSDHFLNGLRVASKKGIIKPEESKIYYFEKAENQLETIAHSLSIDNDGRIDEWPQGFFDEWEKNLDELLW